MQKEDVKALFCADLNALLEKWSSDKLRTMIEVGEDHGYNHIEVYIPPVYSSLGHKIRESCVVDLGKYIEAGDLA